MGFYKNVKLSLLFALSISFGYHSLNQSLTQQSYIIHTLVKSLILVVKSFKAFDLLVARSPGVRVDARVPKEWLLLYVQRIIAPSRRGTNVHDAL